MSRHVVGYEGVGKSRRPIYADEGPASSAVRDPVAAIGVLSATQVKGSLSSGAGGAGAVERRQATEAGVDVNVREREEEPRHLTAPSLARPAPAVPRHDAQMQASRQRGAERHVEVLAARKSSSPPLEEKTVSEAAQAVTTDSRLADPLLPVLVLPCGNCARSDPGSKDRSDGHSRRSPTTSILRSTSRPR